MRLVELPLSALLSLLGHAALIASGAWWLAPAAPPSRPPRASDARVVLLSPPRCARCSSRPSRQPRRACASRGARAPRRARAPDRGASSRRAPPSALPSAARAPSTAAALPTCTARAARPVERVTAAPADDVERADVADEPPPADVETASDAPGDAAELAPLGAAVVLLHRPELLYPDAARRAGVEGTVQVGLEVGADGGVARAWLLRSSGSAALDREALRNVRRWRFDLATVAAGGRFRQAIAFELR
ncbi:MAG: energy transducer TonB [Planctomycetes bacterium]|nr:energy transducer TonB [Planctomycetota bacterium]